MTEREESPITVVLRAAGSGDGGSAADLLPLVYEELRQLARARMAREADGHTLQPTALVHEAYLRVVGEEDPGWNGRGHFFAAAGRAMRRILVEQARRRSAQKRGGKRPVPLGDAEPEFEFEAPQFDAVAIDKAVSRLEAEDPRKGRIVDLRYFAGLTVAETAAMLRLSVSTVESEWRYIRSWLQRRLR